MFHLWPGVKKILQNTCRVKMLIVPLNEFLEGYSFQKKGRASQWFYKLRQLLFDNGNRISVDCSHTDSL